MTIILTGVTGFGFLVKKVHCHSSSTDETEAKSTVEFDIKPAGKLVNTFEKVVYCANKIEEIRRTTSKELEKYTKEEASLLAKYENSGFVVPNKISQRRRQKKS